MEISISSSELKEYVIAQANSVFPDNQRIHNGVLFDSCFDLALERLEHCISHITIRGYSKCGNPYFYHLHMDQYSTFLYYLSNTLWMRGGESEKDFCSKLVLLNRSLSGCWFSYKAKLPDIFILIHPVGTVLGNANYSDYLVVYQNVTVNTNGIHPPTLGKFVTLGAGASILGECVIGDRVGIGATVTMRNKRVSDNSVVYRDEMGKIHFRHKDKSFAENCFVEK